MRNLDTKEEVRVRELTTADEFDQCVQLQGDVFELPERELSPRRHLIVSRRAGGWILGAFVGEAFVGFVHHLVARRESEITGYSHMMAVARSYQNRGVGARLKWAQRERALAEGVSFITWTWDPMQARNAYFNLNRLGAVVRSYGVNFYGTDYPSPSIEGGDCSGIDSDRLFAEWNLRSRRVVSLSRGEGDFKIISDPAASVEIPSDWRRLLQSENAEAARREQLRVRREFHEAFGSDLVCAGFARDGGTASPPRYLFYPGDALSAE